MATAQVNGGRGGAARRARGDGLGMLLNVGGDEAVQIYKLLRCLPVVAFGADVREVADLQHGEPGKLNLCL